jgi:hypothetical protein
VQAWAEARRGAQTLEKKGFYTYGDKPSQVTAIRKMDGLTALVVDSHLGVGRVALQSDLHIELSGIPGGRLDRLFHQRPQRLRYQVEVHVSRPTSYDLRCDYGSESLSVCPGWIRFGS